MLFRAMLLLTIEAVPYGVVSVEQSDVRSLLWGLWGSYGRWVFPEGPLLSVLIVLWLGTLTVSRDMSWNFSLGLLGNLSVKSD